MDLLTLERKPITGLTSIFIAWKGLLLAIALGAAVGPSYDTSTSLYFDRVYGANATVPELSLRLTRWDALYFMHAAQAGKVYEQEWAFGWGISTVVTAIQKSLQHLGLVDSSGVSEPIVAIGIAHLSHWLTVLVMYKLTIDLFADRRLAFLSAFLHILSPAGLFLSSPYAESPFAFLSMLGNLLFARGINLSSSTIARRAVLLGAGVSFGLSSLFRSNGVASGLLFAVQFISEGFKFTKNPAFSRIVTLVVIVLGGMSVAAGTIVPQYIAWTTYCRPSHPSEAIDVPSWCSKTIPSIYTHVQAVYWDVGFLKYWTLNQVPLFLLASPSLILLLVSGTDMLRRPSQHSQHSVAGDGQNYSTLVQSLSGMQLIITTLAITNYHVQIITRLASAYPVWYWWTAGRLLDKRNQQSGLVITSFMILYAGIQGALYAFFLPPA